MLVCAICGKPGVAIEAGSSLCMPHLHGWMLSQEGKTAKRLYGQFGTDSTEKKEIQKAALMKLFRANLQEWKVQKVKDITILL